jgi:hypothetical protein
MIVARITALLCMSVGLCVARAQRSTVIFEEPAFPVADSTAISVQALQQGFAGARAVNAMQLSEALADPASALLVMPYGSAFPEEAWPAILRYLERGGDLIVLGGKPFTQAAFQTSRGWKLRPPSARWC